MKTDLQAIYEQNNFAPPVRLDYCTAWIYENGDYSVLKSYNTIVAIFCRNNHVLIADGFYSKTTSKHIAKFRNTMDEWYGIDELVYLYERSDRIAHMDYRHGDTWFTKYSKKVTREMIDQYALDKIKENEQ